jgi:hypothetical protein
MYAKVANSANRTWAICTSVCILTSDLAPASFVAEQPGVLQVVPSQTYQLHGPGAGTGTMNTFSLV